MQARSDLVKKMNNHFSKSLSLIEEGSADNNAQIREEMKQFFICAEEIEKEIAKFEVSSINKVSEGELIAIEKQKEAVQEFLYRFDDQIQQIEHQIRDVLGNTSYLLDC